jgi:subtilisin-like proprotein convertase family protein
MSPGTPSRRLQSFVLAAALAASPVVARPGPEIPTGNGLFPSAVLIDDSSGNSNGRIDPNECVGLAIQLLNTDPGNTETGISATLSAVTPGVTVVTATSAYPDLPPFGVSFNVTSYRISVGPGVVGTTIELALTITSNNGTAPPRPVFVGAGQLFQSSGTAAIPDNNPTGAFLPLDVSGLGGALTEVEVTVHILHPATDQLDLTLESPNGTIIDLSSDNGAGANYGSSCASVTTFDDDAPAPITLGTPPFLGGWRPEQPLATFAGLTGTNLNGQWRLRVADDTAGATGAIQCVTLRIQTSAAGPGICRTLSIGDRSVVEGNQGMTTVLFPVTMSMASPSLVSCFFTTGDYTATAPSDYTAVSGGLTFQPGEVSKTVAVNVVGDLTDELDEIFVVFLVKGGGAFVQDGAALGTIHDDDGAGSSDRVGAVSHGYEIYTHLAAWNPAEADSDAYPLWEDPYSSYEVVVDAASGDVQPLALQLLTSGTVTVNSVPVGSGPARSLRWMYDTSTVPSQPAVARVASGGCGLDCGADDTYRLRVYETTASISRFNNTGGQVSVLILQASDDPVQLSALFWSPAGTLLHREPRTLAARSTLVLPTQTIPALQGASGSVTVIHDARYGELVGKVVTIDAASGFAFDTPMSQRPR